VTDNAVVQKREPLTEGGFHGALMVDWSRMIRKIGLASFALKARITERQVRNVQAGSTPHALTIFNLLAEDDTALNCVLSEYGLRTAPKEAICSSDPGTLPMAILLQHVAAAEHPNSHGGPIITQFEAEHIPDEDLLAAQRVIDTILSMKRKPLRSVK
jgi:hypothetical protein